MYMGLKDHSDIRDKLVLTESIDDIITVVREL